MGASLRLQLRTAHCDPQGMCDDAGSHQVVLQRPAGAAAAAVLGKIGAAGAVGADGSSWPTPSSLEVSVNYIRREPA